MGQAHSKVITVEADLQSRSLSSPRFDEAAAQMARPVVPLNKGFVSASPRSIINPVSQQASPVLSKKGSWLLAAFVGLILTAGAMAIGVIANKRSPAASTPALIQIAEAIRIEPNQEPGRGQSFRSRRAPAATKNNKRVVRRVPPAFDGRPRARLVDVLR